MPNIPTNIYKREAPGPTGQARASYSGEGQGLQQLGAGVSEIGARLQAIEDRKQDHEDVIKRIQTVNAFKLKAEQNWTEVTREQDITEKEVIQGYHQSLYEMASEATNSYTGTERGMPAVTAEIERLRGQMALSTYNESTKAQQKVIGDYAEGLIGRFSAEAGNAPATIAAQFAGLDDELIRLAPAMTPEQETAYRKMGRSQITVRAATAYLDTGNYAAANDILTAPGVSEVLAPDTLRQLRSQVVVGTLKKQKDANALQAKGQQIEQFIGRQLTDQERLKVVGLAPTASTRQSLAERVAEIEAVTQQPVTTDMVLKMAGASVSTGAGTAVERQMSTMGELADAVETGIASQEDVNRFKNAWAIATKEQRYKDDLGRVVSVTLPIPDYIQNAGATLGLSLDGGPESGPVSGEEVEGTDIPFEQSILGMNEAGTLTGPIAKGVALAGRTPGVGDLTEGGGVYTRNQKYAQTAARDLVRVLQNNPRYAVAEMKSIEAELEIAGSVFDSGPAYQQRALGLRRALMERAEHAAKTSIAAVDAEERSHARNVYNGIMAFLPKLGNPREVKNRAEYDGLVSDGTLRPGDPVILPDGSMIRVPGGR